MRGLDETNLTENQKRVCLLYVSLPSRSKREVARRLKTTRQNVQRHLKAAVRKYPALGSLLCPMGQRLALAA